ncbi:hypothetical protein BRADI_3g14695v3 [Brachypodium distachyon]|uniref:Phytocyanin domain-containing protein n=1 Tax=Brachypodium distachyon TaxID=15368 RepID=A0A0Q3HNQ6_BRADI|nr:hypothetical protein BRADI_3g14695v3 [Brachypodium distachyon]
MAITKAIFLIMVTASALFKLHGGAPAGSWDLKTNYTQWAFGLRFFPGDSLRFQYPAATHNVLEVTKAAYDTYNTSVSSSGNSSAVVIATYQTGNDVILLAASGVTRYFVCGFLISAAAGAVPGAGTRGQTNQVHPAGAGFSSGELGHPC